MKTQLLITSIAATLISATLALSAQAGEYPKNPVVRPLTLTDGTIQLTGAYAYGKQHNKDSENIFGANISYGLTNNLQIGLDGITYSLFKDKSSGFEFATQAGLRGYFDEKEGDSLGLGMSFIGKQIINRNFAVTFGAGYTHWDVDKQSNRSEFDYSAGFLANIASDLTLTGQYTYRDLKDFKQGHANVATIGLNYAVSSQMDIGTSFTWSDFEEEYNGKAFQETPEKMVGIYANWRF